MSVVAKSHTDFWNNNFKYDTTVKISDFVPKFKELYNGENGFPKYPEHILYTVIRFFIVPHVSLSATEFPVTIKDMTTFAHRFGALQTAVATICDNFLDSKGDPHMWLMLNHSDESVKRYLKNIRMSSYCVIESVKVDGNNIRIYDGNFVLYLLRLGAGLRTVVLEKVLNKDTGKVTYQVTTKTDGNTHIRQLEAGIIQFVKESSSKRVPLQSSIWLGAHSDQRPISEIAFDLHQAHPEDQKTDFAEELGKQITVDWTCYTPEDQSAHTPETWSEWSKRKVGKSSYRAWDPSVHQTAEAKVELAKRYPPWEGEETTLRVYTISDVSTVRNIPADQYKVGQRIGEGNSSIVYQGVWKNAAVAIKQVKKVSDLSKFYREIAACQKMGHHPNLVEFFGATYQGHPAHPAILVSYLPYGSVEDFFVSKRTRTHGESVTMKDAIAVALGTANALQYLHECGILHGDVAARNVLVDKTTTGYVARIFDFDLSRVLPEGKTHTKIFAGEVIPVAIAAPDALNLGIWAKSTDVYSFGCFLFELFAGQQPFQEEFVRDRVEPKFPELPKTLERLIRRCWSAHSFHRPTMADVVLILETLLDNFSSSSQKLCYDVEEQKDTHSQSVPHKVFPPKPRPKVVFTAFKPETKPGTKHVMLSYQWDSQKMVGKLCDHLRTAGFPVWMDVMGGVSGQLSASMARGVENAFVIVPILTSKYQLSKNCSLELEYANNKNVPIVPVHMESSFKASGWLGLLTAGRIYVDFFDEKKFEESLANLILEIRNYGNFSPGPIPTTAAVIDWTVEEVGAWLETVQLGVFAKNFSDKLVNGQVLLTITADDLDELGVVGKLPQRRLLVEISNLKKK